jgi:hypothetical protein
MEERGSEAAIEQQEDCQTQQQHQSPNKLKTVAVSQSVVGVAVGAAAVVVKACDRCKLKKRKCDFALPSCSLCLK